MRTEWRSASASAAGSLAAYIGFLAMGRALEGAFDDEKSTFGEAVIQILQKAVSISWATVMVLLITSAVLLIIHLSGVPKPWISFLRISRLLFVPFMVWALSFLALRTTPSLRSSPLMFFDHPLWLLVFFVGGLSWWIVDMWKARRRYLCTGWA